MFLAGYVFKPSHSEIHFMRSDKIDGRKRYENNFTTDKGKAHVFHSVESFQKQLEKFLIKANSHEEHYNFTLAYVDLNTGETTKILSC